jgi:chromosome segregation ATPase
MHSVLSLQLKSFSDRVFAWGLAGPILLLLTLTVGLVKAPFSIGMALPLCSVAALFACWKWQLKGLMAGVSLLVVASVFAGGDLGFFWYSGLILSLSIGLFVASLGFHEVQLLIQQTKDDSARYLEDYLRIEESLKEQDESFQKEKRKLGEQLSELESHFYSQKEELQSTKQLLSVVKVEIEDASRREVDLKRKLAGARERSSVTETAQASNTTEATPKHEVLGAPSVKVEKSAIQSLPADTPRAQGQLSSVLLKSVLATAPTAYTLPALSGRIQHFLNLTEGTVNNLVERVSSLQKGLDVFQKEGQIHLVKMWAKELLNREKDQHMQDDLASKTEELHSAWQEVSTLKTKEERLQQSVCQLEEQNQDLRAKISHLENLAKAVEQPSAQLQEQGQSRELSFFSRSTDFLTEEVKRLKRKNDLYKQLRKQFEEKTEVLDRTREDMFTLETKLLINEIEHEEEKREEIDNFRVLEGEIVDLLEEKRLLESELTSLYQLVESLSTKAQA